MGSRKGFVDKPSGKAPPIESWRVVRKPAPYGDPLKVLRVQVKYLTGFVKTLPASFKSREELDNYVNRFHTEFIGKEHLGEERIV